MGFPKEYDEETCTTAVELRRHGLPLPSEIPDAAWVPDSAINMKEDWKTEDGNEIQLISLTVAVPFQLDDHNYPVSAEGQIIKKKV